MKKLLFFFFFRGTVQKKKKALIYKLCFSEAPSSSNEEIEEGELFNIVRSGSHLKIDPHSMAVLYNSALQKKLHDVGKVRLLRALRFAGNLKSVFIAAESKDMARHVLPKCNKHRILKCGRRRE